MSFLCAVVWGQSGKVPTVGFSEPLESIFLDLQAQLVDGKLNGEDAVVEGPQPHSYLWITQRQPENLSTPSSGCL